MKITQNGFDYQVSDNLISFGLNDAFLAEGFAINEDYEIHQISEFCSVNCRRITATNDPELIIEGVPMIGGYENISDDASEQITDTVEAPEHSFIDKMKCESCGEGFDYEEMIEGEQWFCKPCYEELRKDDEFLYGNAAYEFFDSNYFDAESIEDIMRKHCKPDFVWEVDDVSDADKIKIYLAESRTDTVEPFPDKSALLDEASYWKQRCELAEKCLAESPCDPDITSSQIAAHSAYNDFLTKYNAK